MGNLSSKKSETGTHELRVTTGDKKGAGTDRAHVFIILTDIEGKVSREFQINERWKDNFEKGKTDIFHVDLPSDFKKIAEINIRRDDSAKKDRWFVEKIYVSRTGETDESQTSVFPINRWINAEKSLSLVEFDSTLPQFEKYADQRRRELEDKRDVYLYAEKTIHGAPPQVEIMPEDENFSNSYLFDIAATLVKMKLKTVVVDLTTKEFSSLADIESVYKGILPVPLGIDHWKSDEEFGNQKLAGCNPLLVELCSKIPDHFPVTAELIGSQLEGRSLKEALDSKKLYKIDLRYLADIECSGHRRIPGPTCLLYVRNSGDLVPIAIQIMPVPGEDNPIFTPEDPEYTWLAAKMWFNLADCSHHQSCTHLGFTHLLKEAVAVCTHRRLSPSHPIYRLLAPHFLYLMAINELAIKSLVSPGGWVDKAMQIGRTGMFNIIKRNWALWTIQKDGNILKDFQRRGVDDTEALPNYQYRDDATLLWNAIHKYVSTVVNQVYDTPEKLKEDFEIQAWCKELNEDAKFNGLPAYGFSSNEDLAEVLTVFIFIGSVGHAAANFGQYDEYAFPPNYPASLHAEKPTTKEPLTEDYVVKTLPPKDEAFEVMLITKVLSQKGTNELGNFEVEYAYDPITKKALKSFRTELEEISITIDKRNAERVRKYPYLNPKEVPNAISI